MTGISYAEACLDQHLFGQWFEGPSWATWRVLDKALFGEPLTASELAVFRELTGREEAPQEPAEEIWMVVGRRSAKTLKAASIGVYMSTIGAEAHGYRDRLQRGERGVVQVLAVDRDQARVCLNFVRAFFEQPMLAPLVLRETADGIELNNQMSIEVTTNDRRRVRGRTVCCVVADEVAHWRSERTVSPDEEVYEAVKPAMATMPGALLIGISSPHARTGLLWRKYDQHYGKAGPILVVQARTVQMNPAIDQAVIEAAYERDAAWAAAEYGAEFRRDIESFIAREAIAACTSPGVRERPPQPGIRYGAFVDSSGGVADSMCLAVGSKEDEIAVLHCLREVRPPFNPEQVVREFAELLKRYRVTNVVGDRYAAEWVSSSFSRHGISYAPAGRSKSVLYINLLPMMNAGQVDLLDDPRLVNQLLQLERRNVRGGRSSIDHPPGGHDDLANVLAGVVAVTAGPLHRGEAWTGSIMPDGTVVAHAAPRRTRVRVRYIDQADIWNKETGLWKN